MSIRVSDEETAVPPSPDTAPPPLTRMLVALLGLAGGMLAAYMFLYKVGVLANLACGTGACETVQLSAQSVFLGVPVPLWGVLGYFAIFALALIGIQPGHTEDRRIAAGLFILAAGAFLFSLYLSYIEAFVIHAWCRWCIGSAVIATLLFLLSLAELPRLRGGVSGRS